MTRLTLMLPANPAASTLLALRSGLFWAGFSMLALCCPAVVTAQAQSAEPAPQSEQSLEELEAFLEKQKAELETVIENRETALQRQAEVRERLQEQQARQEELEAELMKLCEEHNAASPDSPIDCEKELEPL